jgi:hypothetical protein
MLIITILLLYFKFLDSLGVVFLILETIIFLWYLITILLFKQKPFISALPAT